MTLEKEELKLSYIDPFLWWKRSLKIDSKEWKILRKKILERYNYSCFFCNIRASKYMIVDHVNGDATNNSLENLRVLCPMCDTIRHCGLAGIKKMLIIRKSKFSQLDIVVKTRSLFLKNKKVPDPKEIDLNSSETNLLPVEVAAFGKENVHKIYKAFFTENFFLKNVSINFLYYLY